MHGKVNGVSTNKQHGRLGRGFLGETNLREPLLENYPNSGGSSLKVYTWITITTYKVQWQYMQYDKAEGSL